MKNERLLLHVMLDKVLDVQDKTEHYTELVFSNLGNEVRIYAMEGEFDAKKDYSLEEEFEREKIPESIRFKRALAYLDSLLEK